MTTPTSPQYLSVDHFEGGKEEDLHGNLRPQTNSAQVGLVSPLSHGSDVHARHLVLHDGMTGEEGGSEGGDQRSTYM